MISRYAEKNTDHGASATEVDDFEVYDQDQHYHQHDEEGGLEHDAEKGEEKAASSTGAATAAGLGAIVLQTDAVPSLRAARPQTLRVPCEERRDEGKGKCGKSFTNKGKGNYKVSGKVGSFQNYGYM